MAVAPDLEPTVTLPWLVRLRWAILVGQLVVMPLANLVFGVAVSWWALGATSAVIALSNLVITRVPGRWPRTHVMGGVLILDVALMTVLFAAAGGAMNPFTVFYLVHITLSAVVLDAKWTIAIAVLSMAGFGLLFLAPAPPHVHTPGMDMSKPGMAHLQGMWVAFVLAAALSAFFVGRITRAMASQREQIATLRESAARNARLAALTTLAAGAAHELNNPLATIAVAAHEARLRAEQIAAAGPVADDLRLILDEVDRCQAILHQMAARAEHGDDAQPTTFGELARKIRSQLGEARADRVELAHDPDARVSLPTEQMAQSVVALVKNALDASAPTAHVVVTLAHDAEGVRVQIADRGPGIPADVLAKIGEPFFTTKEPGRGMGLGVFLARAFFESRGGHLAIESSAGLGTTVRAYVPTEPA
ncbi:MAG: ATP-binding protein [Proteobacteria bacterium]|nr:ATP-binding protein [Pseudomonadota bacterium]